MAVSTGYITISDTLDGVSTAQIFTRSTDVPTSLPVESLRLTDTGFRFEDTGTFERYTWTVSIPTNTNSEFITNNIMLSDNNGALHSIAGTNTPTNTFPIGSDSALAMAIANILNGAINGVAAISDVWDARSEGANVIIEAETGGDIEPNLTGTFSGFRGTTIVTGPVVLDGAGGGFTSTQSGDWYVNEADVPTGTGRIWSRSAGYAGSDISPSATFWRSAVAFQGADGSNGAPGAPGAPGDAGDDGDGLGVIYIAATSLPDTPDPSTAAPSGWSFTPPTRTSLQRLYVSVGTRVNNTGNYTWSAPFPFESVDGDSGTSAFAVDAIVNRNIVQNVDGTFPTDDIIISALFTEGATASNLIVIDTLTVAEETGVLTPTNGDTTAAGRTVAIGSTTYRYQVVFSNANRTATITLETTAGAALALDVVSVNISNSGRGDVSNFIFIDVDTGQTPDTPAPSEGVPTAPFVGTNAISYTWVDSPPTFASGVVWASQGTQSGGEGNFTWATPTRFTGVEGRSSRLDIAYFTNEPEIQAIDVTGTRSNVVSSGSANTTAVLSLPSNFNSGNTFTGASNSSSESTSTSISLGNNVFIDVDNSYTYSANDVGVVVQVGSSFASSMSSTALSSYTFNLGAGTQFRDITFNSGNRGATTFRVYSLRTGNTLTGGGIPGQSNGANAALSGWSIGSSVDNYAASNIPNEAALGAVTIPGGNSRNFGSNGIRDSGTSGSGGDQVGVFPTDGRGSAGWSMGSAGGVPVGISFRDNVFVYMQQGTPGNTRVLLNGPSGTFTGRRARLRNAGTGAITISGTIGGTTLTGTLDGGDSTPYEEFNAFAATWNVSFAASVATWTFDPDIDNAFHPTTTIVTNRAFTQDISASQALLEMSTILRGLPGLDADTSVTVSGAQTTLSVDLGSMLALRPDFQIVLGNGINLSPMSVGVQGQSSYTITDYNGSVVDSFTSSVARPFDTDRDFVISRIVDEIDDNLETPINFNAERRGSTLRIFATTTGAVGGLWVIGVNHAGATGADIGNITFGTAAETTIGRVSSSFPESNYPSGTITNGNYTGANPRRTSGLAHNHIGERLVFWGEGTDNVDEPAVSTNSADYAVTRLF